MQLVAPQQCKPALEDVEILNATWHSPCIRGAKEDSQGGPLEAASGIGGRHRPHISTVYVTYMWLSVV